MKIQIENLRAQMRGAQLNGYQRALALDEYYKLLDYVEELEQLTIPAVINSVAAPEWLTTERRAEAKMKYESHVFGDSNRVKAVEMIRMWAGLAGYTIGLKKASELLQQHCL